ncbi:MAG: hypothetical protein HYS67_01815 [Deltaproteobacteria bacterium]|nr:hypothetical protein [Deltaproteobacteria bacterium]
MRTAPDANQAKQFFTVTHPFHPWHGRRFELIDHRQRWGQWRVYYVTKNGCQSHLPASWTDAGPEDPFVEQAQGRAIARVSDLLQLAAMIPKTTHMDVKEIKPHV